MSDYDTWLEAPYRDAADEDHRYEVWVDNEGEGKANREEVCTLIFERMRELLDDDYDIRILPDVGRGKSLKMLLDSWIKHNVEGDEIARARSWANLCDPFDE